VFDLDLAKGMDPATNHAGCYVITDEVGERHEGGRVGKCVGSMKGVCIEFTHFGFASLHG
jgi:hypothetical protein